jgi:hypothetical protein
MQRRRGVNHQGTKALRKSRRINHRGHGVTQRKRREEKRREEKRKQWNSEEITIRLKYKDRKRTDPASEERVLTQKKQSQTSHNPHSP